MLFFSIISLPAIFILLKKKITYKEISLFFLGVLLSSLTSLIMWALSTFFHPDGISLLNKSIKLFLNSVSPVLILSLFHVFHYLSKWKLKLPSDSFKCGFIYWNMLFVIIQGSHDHKYILIPIFYMFILVTTIYVDRVKFVVKDNIIKGVFYLFMPIYLLIVLLLVYYSYVGTVVIGLVSLMVYIIFLFDIKNVRKLISEIE